MPETITHTTDISGRRFRHYDFVMVAFVAVLLCSNLIGAAKIASISGFQFGAGILFFRVCQLNLSEVSGNPRGSSA